LALIAAREGVRATGVDIAANLIERAQARAAAEGLRARFREADAEALPFADASFDVVVTLLGAMFAPRPQLVAGELTRVCAPGGTIAMANWTAEGFVGKMFRAIAKFIAPSGMPSPVLWGNEAVVKERFGSQVFNLTLTRRNFTFDYPFPPSDVVNFFRLYYGPVNRAFASLDRAGRKQLHQELEAIWSAENRGRDGFTLVTAEYLEVIALRA
jgi:SAM-dependent methyltransferase